MHSVIAAGAVLRCRCLSNSAPAVRAVTPGARGAKYIKSGNRGDIRSLASVRRRGEARDGRDINTQFIDLAKGRPLRVCGGLQVRVRNNSGGKRKSTDYKNRRCGTLQCTELGLFGFPSSLYMCNTARSQPSKGKGGGPFATRISWKSVDDNPETVLQLAPDYLCRNYLIIPGRPTV